MPVVNRYGRSFQRLQHLPSFLDVPRLDQSALDQAVTQALSRYPEGQVYVLTGPQLRVPRRPRVHPLRSIEDLPESDSPRVVVLALESDEDALKAARSLKGKPNTFYFGANAALPTARYFHRNNTAWRVLREDAALGLEKHDTADFENILQALEVTRHLPGDYVEIGVYKGTSAHAALHYMAEAGIQRRVYLLDVYEGFTYSEAGQSADAVWQGTHQDVQMDRVAKLLSGFRVPHELVKSNVITDDLPAEIEQIAVCNVDVDLYEAVAAALRRVAPYIPVGGIIIAEDQGHTPLLLGGYMAVVEFLESEAGLRFVPVHLSSGQMYLIRVAS
jgi:hypothetical protein